MKSWLVFLALIVPVSFAQGSISGTLYAKDVRGFVIIGCLLDLNTRDCNYEKSPYVTLEQRGSSAAFELENAPTGNYLVIAWKDSNGNGNLDEEQDEVGYYVDSSNEPALVTAPASNIDIRLTASVNNPLTLQPANNSLASTPTQPTQNTSPLGDLVGIWQMTRASGGDYKNLTTGFTFSMTSGFSTLLKIRADGSYMMDFYSSGVSNNCAFVSNFEQSAGTVTYQGDQLILQPAWHTLELTDCTSPGKQDMGTEPIVYTFKLEEEFDYNGLRGIKLGLTGGAIPLDMELLHREPLMPGYQPKQPADFVLGTDPPYKEILGLWTPSPDSDINFYNPQTGEFYIPEWNGAEHSYLRFNDDGSYEMARAWKEYSYEGICEKDYIYYEKGTPTFSITEPPQYQGANVIGDAQFKATDARLVVNIHECDEDTAVLRYTLVPQISYYRWNFRPETNDLVYIPEGFSVQCVWEKSEWQFMFCDGYGYSGRSYGRKP